MAAFTHFGLVANLTLAAPPKVNYLFPAGGQRGQTAAITASGDFSSWPVQAWADRPGLTVTCDKDKGKFQIAVAANAVPGVYWLRLTDGEGASLPKPFIVGTLPEIAEAETNDLPDKPQTVDPRVVVNGKLTKNGDLDGYRVELKAGQTLVASLQANSVLGSPMDPVLQVCEIVERPYSTSVESFVASQNHDAVGLDPRLAFTAPRDGSYLVRLFAFPATPDSSIRYAGADTFVYRLTLTTGGFIDHVLPLAVPREDSQVWLEGWNLGNHAAVQVAAANLNPLSPPDDPFDWVWHPDAAGAFPLSRIERGNITVSAGLNDLAKAQEVQLPVTISGRLLEEGDVQAFAFDAAKDQKLRAHVAARSLGFLTDAVVSVLDPAGKVLAEADDTGRDDRDPQLDFTIPADGRYRVLIRDLAGRGGLRQVYRLTIEPIVPDFSLTLAADSFVLDKDKPLEIPVNITVRDGLRETIEIHVLGLPPGITAEPVKFQPTEDTARPSSGGGRRSRRGGNSDAPSGPSVKLILKADSAIVQVGGTPFRIEGRIGGASPLVRTARFPLNLPLAGSHHAAWLTVRK